LKALARIFDWLIAIATLGLVVSCVLKEFRATLFLLFFIGTVFYLGFVNLWKRQAHQKTFVSNMAKVLGVRLGVEGLKQVLLRFSQSGRVEEALVDDLAQSMTNDSLVGVYFLFGMFHAESLQALFVNAAKFSRVSFTLLGPFNWIRETINHGLSLDWLNPWWINSPMADVRNCMNGHWINFNLFGGFKPFLWLRRNSFKLSSTLFVGAVGTMLWTLLPRKKHKPAVEPKVAAPLGPMRELHSPGFFRWYNTLTDSDQVRLAAYDYRAYDRHKWGVRPEEAKGLTKGKGKNKGRSQSVRATGQRAGRVKTERKSNRSGGVTHKRNTTVSSELHWYDDDQVAVYDPMRDEEIRCTLGSKEFKELYKVLRENNMAEQAQILNYRTNTVSNLYGDVEGQPEYMDYQEDDYDSGDEVYERQEELWCRTTQIVEIGEDDLAPHVVHTESSFERTEESSLGRDRIVLSNMKGGIATTDEGVTISVIVVSGRMVLMQHFINEVKGKTFTVTLDGQDFRVDKTEGCALGEGGELMTFALPRIVGFKSSKTRIGIPTPSLNGCEVVLVRFDAKGPSEISCGKWHDGSYTSFSEKGWCGSAVMAIPVKGAPVMVGVHRWGVGPDGLNACEPFDLGVLQYFQRKPPHPTN